MSPQLRWGCHNDTRSELKVFSFMNSTEKIRVLVDWRFVIMIDQSINWSIVWLIDWSNDWQFVKIAMGRLFRILHLIDINTWLIDRSLIMIWSMWSWFDHSDHDLVDWSILSIAENDIFCMSFFIVYMFRVVQWQIFQAQFYM